MSEYISEKMNENLQNMNQPQPTQLSPVATRPKNRKIFAIIFSLLIGLILSLGLSWAINPIHFVNVEQEKVQHEGAYRKCFDSSPVRTINSQQAQDECWQLKSWSDPVQIFGFPVRGVTYGYFTTRILLYTLIPNWAIWSVLVYLVASYWQKRRLASQLQDNKISMIEDVQSGGVFVWVALVSLLFSIPGLLPSSFTIGPIAQLYYLAVFYYLVPLSLAIFAFIKQGFEKAILSFLISLSILWGIPAIVTQVQLVVHHKEIQAQEELGQKGVEDFQNAGYPIRIINPETGEVMNQKSMYVTSPIVIRVNVLVDELGSTNILHAKLLSEGTVIGTADLFPTSDPVSNNRKNFLGTLTYTGVSGAQGGSLEVSGIEHGNIGQVFVVFQ